MKNWVAVGSPWQRFAHQAVLAFASKQFNENTPGEYI
jgi:hypothetical protein